MYKNIIYLLKISYYFRLSTIIKQIRMCSFNNIWSLQYSLFLYDIFLWHFLFIMSRGIIDRLSFLLFHLQLLLWLYPFVFHLKLLNFTPNRLLLRQHGLLILFFDYFTFCLFWNLFLYLIGKLTLYLIGKLTLYLIGKLTLYES